MSSIEFEQLTAPVREVAEASMKIMDAWWNPENGLLPETTDGLPLPDSHAHHHTRESLVYALGLLMRNRADDWQTATRIIDAVLNYQYDEPGQPYHGTFFQYAETPHPPVNSRIWRDYDPNWREFLGTNLAVILLHYEKQLEKTLVEKIDRSLKLLIAGTLTRDLPATYTNIALMKAYMLVFTGERFNEPAWKQAGEELAEEIFRLFGETGHFEEFNSPTYYGIDFIALGLWATYPASSRLNVMGRQMEAALWLEVSESYHAGLKNMCGPFDRTYGMDMRKYVTPVGLALRTLLPAEIAPLPDISVAPDHFEGDHKDDIMTGVWLAAVGVRIPPEAMPSFEKFEGERLLERIISNSPQRVSTSFLSEHVMLGGEDTNGLKPVSGQYHPLTIHWKKADQPEVSWLKLISSFPTDAVASKNGLKLKSYLWPGVGHEDRNYIFRAYIADHAQLAPDAVKAGRWELPGLTVKVVTNASGPWLVPNGEFFDLVYTADHHDGGSIVLFDLKIVENDR